jgi:hypothetical protein
LIGLALAVAAQVVTGTVSISLPGKAGGLPYLAARVSTDYVARRDGESEARLLLDTGTFTPRHVTCDGCGTFRLEQGSGPPAIVVPLARPLPRGATVRVTVEYDGDLTPLYKAKEEYLELGLDDFWYPIHPAIGEVDFTYDLDVRVTPRDVTLVTNGRATRTRHGWHVVSRRPDFDIDLVLGRHLTIDRDTTGGYDLAVVSQDLPAGVSKELLGGMRRVLDFYNSSFGRNDEEHAVTGVIRAGPSPDGVGGYFRKGYFVLPRLTDGETALPNVAHELAHYWWLRAGQQNAWLNESFAEYSAMMAMRELRGRAAFDAMVVAKVKRAASLPPLYGFDRTKDPKSSPGVLYNKGPLVLHALEDEIGTPAFLEFLRRAAVAQVTDTDALVELLAKASSRPVADDFLRRLKE